LQLFYECRIFHELVCPKQKWRNTWNNGYTHCIHVVFKGLQLYWLI